MRSWMKKMPFYLPSFIYISLLIFTFGAQAKEPAKEQITLTVISLDPNATQYQLSFDEQPRLSLVIERGAALIRDKWVKDNAKEDHAHNSDPIFWQGAGLFSDIPNKGDIDKNSDIRARRGHALNKLKALSTIWAADKKSRNAALSLLAFIEQSTFKQRLWVNTDPDTFLVGNNGTQWVNTNPLLSGNLTLLLPSRLAYVWVLGAVDTTMQVYFSPTRQAENYVDDAKALYRVGINSVAVIQPDGHLESHDVAYWNKTPKNVAPGAMIFVPFKGLPSALSSLNQDIPSLLQHRVM